MHDLQEGGPQLIIHDDGFFKQLSSIFTNPYVRQRVFLCIFRTCIYVHMRAQTDIIYIHACLLCTCMHTPYPGLTTAFSRTCVYRVLPSLPFFNTSMLSRVLSCLSLTQPCLLSRSNPRGDMSALRQVSGKKHDDLIYRPLTVCVNMRMFCVFMYVCANMRMYVCKCKCTLSSLACISVCTSVRMHVFKS
jgi:hypothetical protein